MKKLMFIFVYAIFLCSLVAAGNEVTTRLGDGLDLKVTCLNNGYCSASAVCNITVLNPDKTLLLDNVQLDNNNNYHNYTLTSSDLDELGRYPVTGYCQDGSVSDIINFEILVSVSGTDPAEINPNILIAFLLAAIVFFVIGSYFEKGKWIVKYCFSLLAMYSLVLCSTMFRVLVGTSENLILVANSFFIITISISLLMTGFALVVATVWSVEKIKEVNRR